jgi:signal transduction histidine kinase
MTARLRCMIPELMAGRCRRIYDLGRSTLRDRSSTAFGACFGLDRRLIGRRLVAPRWMVLAATLASAAVTALVALSPKADNASREPALRAAIETTTAMIATIGAFLMAGHFKRRRRLDDLLLAHALSLFAVTNLVFGVVPAIDGHGASSGFATSAAFTGGLLATIAFAAAALLPARRAVQARWAGPTLLLVPMGLLALTAAATAFVESNLPAGVEAQLAPEERDLGWVAVHPLILGGILVLLALFIAAAAGFARRAERDRERHELIRWLATASVFAAFAQLNGLLSPSLEPDAVDAADGFRVTFYMTVLVGAAREVRSYWSAMAEMAVVEERQRIARDLHDGLAQELAFISRNLQRLPRASAVVQRLEAASGRALQQSRLTIAALTEPYDRPLDAVLAEVALDVAAREGGRVVLWLAQGVNATPVKREVLVRITSEAISNAIRHGGSALVYVQLKGDAKALRLRIVDAGRGFDPRAVPPGRFGLVSMRERIEAVGGQLRVRSIPGRGTYLEVVL